jgi:hypothetical protein
MVKRVLSWTALSLLTIIVIIGGFAAYLYLSLVPFHELDSNWYGAHQQPTEASATSFRARHRLAVLRAEADHLIHPVRESRVIGLLAASPPDESGDIFLFFGFRFAPGDIGLHEFAVYCWSERQQRFVWKGLQNNSP